MTAHFLFNIASFRQICEKTPNNISIHKMLFIVKEQSKYQPLLKRTPYHCPGKTSFDHEKNHNKSIALDVDLTHDVIQKSNHLNLP